ncbi:MAG: hypothetical protein AB8B60_05105 [Sulfitobacter sp.]
MRSGLRKWAEVLAPAGLIAVVFASAGVAQNEAPLSVIDWLGTQPKPELARPEALIKPDEPPVAKTALAPDVTVKPLGEGGPREIGLVPDTITGLPRTLWAGSDVDRVIDLIADLPDLHLPAAQSLLYTVLLAEAGAPGGKSSAGDDLARARVAKLMERGALDPALSLMEQAGPTSSPAHFDLWMQISLLTGTEDRACALLQANPHLTRNYGTRIFCTARAQQWEDAALTFGSAQALGLMPPAQLALFERFLDPEAFDGEAPLPTPRQMDPLSFRLFETIGEPVPTRNLPRAYAVADLRDLAGWKAQIEAAERLARAGALPDNRLLGLYTDRQAAASGGVWDRVARLQRFETALSTGSADAVAKTLPPVWTAMAEAELEASFAALFAAPLATIALDGRAGRIAQTVQLLSPAYEAAAAAPARPTLATGIAQGEVPQGRPANIMEAAVYDAFDQAAPRADLVAMVAQDRLGEAILQTLALLHDGARGKARALTDALATLRALGLEDTARRAALQTLLMDR